ncbi:MAG TPA: cytochrome C oxidase subunit IV family protein [Polyangia bacterium]
MADKKKSDAEQAHEEHGPGRYVVIWLALLTFTITTVVTGRMDLGSANLPLAMIIATVKATLVVLFFMHLWDSEGINRLVFGVALLFVLVLLLGVFGDLWTRMPDALPTGRHAHSLEEGDMPSTPAGAPLPHAE